MSLNLSDNMTDFYWVDFFIQKNWGSGFQAGFSLSNDSNSRLDEWVIEFTADFEIQNIWGAEILSHEGDNYVIRGASWNGVAPGGEVTFGFIGKSADGQVSQPNDLQLNGELIGDEPSSPDPTPEPTTLTTVSIGDATVTETDGGVTTINLNVELSQISQETVSVEYATANNTAFGNEDYTPTTGTITFAPGETQKTISLAVLGDTIDEDNESFWVNLTQANNAEAGDMQGQVTILDNDSPRDDITVEFDVLNDWDSGFTGQISLTNDGSTAIEGWELSFYAGFDIQNSWNAIKSDQGNTYEFSNLSWNSTIGVGQTVTFGFNGSGDPYATNFIFNDNPVDSTPTPAPEPEPTPEPAPLLTLSIGDASITEADTGITTINLNVDLSEISQETVSVQYGTNNGTAIAGSDFTAVTGILNFAPGQTSQTISVSIQGDLQVEDNETFSVQLSNPSGASFLDDTATVTILNNDTPPRNLPNSPIPRSSGNFNYGEALQKSFLFFEAQRSGDLDESSKRIDWRGDSALSDGADVGQDLSGGYYDAGDHVKFGLPMAYSMTMLAWGALTYTEAYETMGQLDEVMEAIRWGTDYFLKAHVVENGETQAFYAQVGDGHVDHAYWGAPEDMTMNRPSFAVTPNNPGTEVAAETAAALAAASILFREQGEVEYANTLLTNAQQLYDFADTYRGKYSDSIPNVINFYNSWSGYQDELAWGASWLYDATGDTTFLQKAESTYQSGTLSLDWTINWDDKSHGVAVKLAQQVGDNSYYQDVENWLNAWTDGHSGVQITDGGLRWIDEWGSLRYAANTAFVAGVYADTVNDPNGKYSDLAGTTVDYLLGDNPRGSSYVVGFGENAPVNPHHRSSHGGTWADLNSVIPVIPNRNILFGALVGGPASANGLDYEDNSNNYITNEVALDYNAAFTGALARSVNEYGGVPLTNAELDALPGISLPSEIIVS